MELRQLRDSGLRVPKLCLGTVSFGHAMMSMGVVGPDDADVQVSAALDAGVNFLDAADVYSRGDAVAVACAERARASARSALRQ